MWQDLRYAARSLARRPLVSAVAVLSLALGIGVNATIVSLFDGLVLRRLPVPDRHEIVNLLSPGPRPGRTSSGDSGGLDAIFSYPLFRDIEGLDRTGLRRIGAHRDFRANLAYRGRTINGEGLLVSGGYFSVLGLRPALGRLLTAADDTPAGSPAVAVLSYSYWANQLGANPAVIDSTLVVNGRPLTIVGVTPRGFSATTPLKSPDVFVPLVMAGELRQGLGSVDRRDDHWLYLIARLDPGVSRDQAEALINVPFAGLLRDLDLPIMQGSLSARARDQFLQRRLVLEDGSRGSVSRSGRQLVEMMFLVLMAVTGCVLLIACANVANLLLSRLSDRSREIAIRLSVGASRIRIARLLLIEACLLGLAGGFGALVVGRLALYGLLTMLPPEQQPPQGVEIDASMWWFTLSVGLATGLLFGLLPAWQALRPRTAASESHPEHRSASRPTARLRAVLATAQIAVAMALLTEAGLFVSSLSNIGRVDLGLRPDGLVTFRLQPDLNGYTPERTRALFDGLEQELRGLTGVASATASNVPLLSSSNWGSNVAVEGFAPAPDADTHSQWAAISGDYFGTLGIPLLAGRDFTTADDQGSPRVAIVNEAFVRKFGLGRQPIGKRMAVSDHREHPLDIEIVGLVRDAKYSEVKDPPPPQYFLPSRQSPARALTFYIRSQGDARELLRVIPAVVARSDPNLPLADLRTLSDQIWVNTTVDRVLTTLSTVFAVLATLLAAMGLYAVLAYSVARRVREIGIRMALGATSMSVRRLIFGHVGRMAVVGTIVGGAAAAGLGRFVESLLFGVEGFDSRVFISAMSVIAVVVIGAGLLPARRAVRVNPVDALRGD